jgi:uncharacterized membrane protein YfcA
MDPFFTHLVLFGAGCVAGTLNVVAGGGTFLTLPLLIFLGLPATVANGTNRVALLAQNTGAVWSFRRHRIIDWRWVRLAALPAAFGAMAGSWAAVRLDDASFQRILAAIMVLFVVLALWSPRRIRAGKGLAEVKDLGSVPVPALAVTFFTVGLYGGFVQAGAGFLILAVGTLAGLDLVRGNALKVLVVLVYTPVALAMFAAAGKVDWGMGVALAAGNLLGGLAGVRLTVLKGHAWVRRVVIAMIMVFAVKLWLAP